MIVYPVDTGFGHPAMPPEYAAAAQEDPFARRCRRIEAYHPLYRSLIGQLTVASPALEDLADSFPALLFALASGFGTPSARAGVLDLVERGAGLREAAGLLGLAPWLRRLPPGAFTGPLPPFSQDSATAQRMASLVPTDPVPARLWLDGVVAGWRGCSEDFALWVAGGIGRPSRLALLPFAQGNLRLLAAWGWHADRPDTLPHRLLRRAWTPAMGHRRALDEIAAWRQRIDLALVLSARRGGAEAPAAGQALGYEFHPLESAEDFVSEADIMDNCLDQFADRLAMRFSRVYSIRRNGRSVANVEIGTHDEEASMPAIRQLRGVRNRRAPPEVWQATYAWLGAQAARPIPPEAARGDATAIRSEARRLWEPYLAAVEHRWPAAEFRALANGFMRGDLERAESVRRAAMLPRLRRASDAP